ncbi:MAG: lipo-like protein, partial [Roseiarcus sp.]
SHAALYIGDALGPEAPGGEPGVLVEAQPTLGVIAVPLSKYAHFNTRICRPVGLGVEDCRKLVAFALAGLGKQYDNRHVLDLARYLLPYPPVPVALRRRLLALGSGDPTRAICSTLIAQAFHSIRYPILPHIVREADAGGGTAYGTATYVQREILHIRDCGLFTPRDFDVSPYFAIIKPTIEGKFDYRSLIWAPD